MIEKIITEKDANQRVDKYVRKLLNDAPLSFIYKVFRKKDVKINNKKVDIDYILKVDDVIKIYITDEQVLEFDKPKQYDNFKFVHKIIYEDNNILIVDKPKGLLVHGDEGEKKNTLANQVISYLIAKGEYNPRLDKGFTPAPAHRLDRNTSGLVVFGKNLPSLQVLLDLFKDKEEIEKHYYALVVGIINNRGEVNAPLLKDEKKGLVKVASLKDGAKTAITQYEVVRKFKNYTLLDVNLITGRTHQIRVHMSYIGHPLVGDSKYGDFKVNKYFKDTYKYDSQFLHAYYIKFKNLPGVLSYLSGKAFSSEMGKKENDILRNL